jgi:nucleotide-binding universal stress UspA family protein
MLPVHTILHPTDLSENAQSAFHLACALARDCGARVIVLHVLPTPQGHEELVARRWPEAYYRGPWQVLHEVQAPDHNVHVEHRLEEGDDPARQIVEVAKEVKAGLIVLGTHGRGGLRHLLMGSVAEEVLRRAPCPEVTIRNSVPVPCDKMCEALC